MTSQLNVDTIVDKAGSGGSNVKMANTSTYVSDGGDVSQNTVQGLAKAWVNFNGTGTIAIRDSLNVASLTDSGTGIYVNNLTNPMSAANFSSFAGGDVNNGNDDVRRNNRLWAIQTGLVRVVCGFNGNSNTKEDWTNVYTSIHGGLA
tara:strand:+ start:49 stop:489 length:441 start_codon:yes stop_codon:yes gene_type:complete